MLNGIAVAFGIGVIQLLFAALAGAPAAQLASTGAVCTSLADVPNTVGRTWQRVVMAALLSVAAALVVALLRTHPVALGFGVAGVAFVAMMTLAWGLRAGAVSFAPILSLVFSMAVPQPGPDVGTLVMWQGLGALAYVVWSLLATALRDGWSLMRFLPDGSVERVVGLPVPAPSDLCFGGPDGCTLHVVTARESNSKEALAHAPLSGRLFELEVEVAGVPAFVLR